MKLSIIVNVLLCLGQLAIWHITDLDINVFCAGINLGMAITATAMHIFNTFTVHHTPYTLNTLILRQHEKADH